MAQLPRWLLGAVLATVVWLIGPGLTTANCQDQEHVGNHSERLDQDEVVENEHGKLQENANHDVTPPPEISQSPQQSSARIIFDRQPSHIEVHNNQSPRPRPLPAPGSLLGSRSGNVMEWPPRARSFLDTEVRLAGFDDDSSVPLPKIFYGPPPQINLDPDFNSPSGARDDSPPTMAARRSRPVPVRIPSYFELEVPERKEPGTADPLSNQWPRRLTSQDPPAEEIDLAPPPPPPSVRMRLFDESSQTPPASSFQGMPSSPPGGLWDVNERSRPQPLEVDCTVHCSPLFYSFVWGGWQSLRNVATWSSDPWDVRGLYDFDQGVASGIGLGIYHGPNWRADLELALRSNPLDALHVWRPAGSPNEETLFVDGHLKSYAGMANFYWDFSNIADRTIQPYVGAGVGFVFLDPDVHSVGRPILDPRYDRDSSFAYQWMAGLNARVNQQFDLFCEYRFFAADSFHMNTNVQTISGRAGDPTSLWGNLDYRSQNILLGLRYKF